MDVGEMKKEVLNLLTQEVNLIKCKFCGREYDLSEIPPTVLDKWKKPTFCSLCLSNALQFRSEPKIGYKLLDRHSWVDTMWDEEFEKPSRSQMVTDLKKFAEELSFIPKSFVLKQFPTQKFYVKCDPEKVIPLLINYQMAWARDYKEEFGSWMKSLYAANILNEYTFIETPYGYQCIAEDGHKCLSLNERKIDNFMNGNGIAHEKEPRYPSDINLNPNKRLRADWKAGEYFIEFFGLMIDEDYAENAEKKKKLAKKHNIKLISLYPKDLGNLEEKLSPMLQLFY